MLAVVHAHRPLAPPSPRWLAVALAVAAGCGSTRVATPPGASPVARAPAAPAAAPAVASGHAATYTRYAVATDHPEASLAGAEVLAAGGTAADAAAAAMLALGVASPQASGLGGGGFALYYRARDRRVTFLDFRERAPAATPATIPPPAPGAAPGGTQRAAGLAVGVPGEPRGIEALLERFGALPRARVVAPAARLAEQGFTPSEYTARLARLHVDTLRRDPLGAQWVPEGSDGLRAGVALRNPALARTLRAFGERGAGVFYEGPLAEEIVRAARAAGGVLTLDDLRGYRVAERAPLEGSYYGHRWVTAPPESAGGYTMLASLALLERWHPGSARPDEAALLHAFAESWRGPFLDRARYFGDPDFVTVPVAALLAPARVATRAALFDPARARPAGDYDLPLPERPAATPAAVPVGAGTSHVCVVDAEGNVASVTTTVNDPFGAGFTVGGFWLNNELDDFTAPPARGGGVAVAGGANRAAPGRRPVSSMTPTIVFAGDLPSLCVGGSGGTRITTSVTQAAYRIVALGMAPGEAVAHPRIHQAAAPETLSAETTVPEVVLAALRAQGHAVEPLRFGAIVQAVRIVRGPRGVALEAASDPRKGGRPAGL